MPIIPFPLEAKQIMVCQST